MDNALLFILGQVVTGAAIWGGIRVDIRAMHTRMDDIKKAADDAHARMDRHLESTANNGHAER